MSDFPCRVSLETRDYLEEQARNEIEWDRSRGIRMEAAIEALSEVAELKKILNDESLAAPLAAVMQDFDQSMNEMNQFALEGKNYYVMNLLRNVSRLRSTLIEMHMGEV